METTEILERGFNLTLKEQVKLAEEILEELDITCSLGEMLMRRKSDVSYSESAALVALSCSLKRLTGVLYQLRYWMEHNGYAITLTTKQVLTSWSGGSVLLMELINTVFMAVHYQAIVDWCLPNLVQDVVELYED